MHYQKLFHYARVLVAVGILVVLYTIQVYAASGGSEPSSRSISDEPEIFARVLKETLDSAGLGEFVSGPFGVRSPIGTGIQSDYIPTVGLLVRVPVSFPISAPTETETLDEPSTDSNDLWEKYSNSGSLPEQRARVLKMQRKMDTQGQVAVDPNAIVHREEIRIDGPRNIRISAKGDELDNVGKFFVDRIAPKVDIMVNGFRTAPYEESRVTKLREAILDVVAQYGHRVSSVQEGERIIVVVEAPMPGGPVNVLIGEEDSEPFPELVPFHTRLDGKSERMLIAAPKSAVTSASTREAIAAQITEKRY